MSAPPGTATHPKGGGTLDAPAAGATDRPERRWRGPVAVGLGATVLAATWSWSVSLWSDEVATVSAATRSLHDLDRLLGHIDAVHGAYYLLMHLWVGWFGASPFALRLPSALAVGAAAAGVHVLVRRLADSRTALTAALTFAVLPRVTWAGIEARPFALSIALAVWLTVVLHVAVTRRSWPAYAGYAGLLALAAAINLYVVLLVAAHGVTLLARAPTRRAVGRFVVAAVAGLAIASPVVLAAGAQGGQLGRRALGLAALAQNVLVNQWFLGQTPTSTTASGATLDDAVSPSGIWKVAGLALAVVCWALVVRAVVTARSRPSDGPAARKPVQRAGHVPTLAWALPWLVVPTVVVLAAAVLVPSAYNPRYLGFCAPAVAMTVAVGLVSLPRRPAVGVAVVLLLMVAPVYISQRTTTAKSGADWSLVAARLDGRTHPGDGVYFGPRDDPRDGQVVRSLRAVALGYPAPFEGLRDVTLLASPADGATLFGTSATLAGSMDRLDGIDRLWVLRRQDRPQDAATEDLLLQEAGFSVVTTWDGPQTEVVELVRD